MNPTARPPALAWLQALSEPAISLQWSLADWQRVIRLARRLRLLGRLAEACMAANIEASLPAPVQRQLRGERAHSRARLRALLWTVEQVHLVLHDLGLPLVLLKGAAYVAQALPVAAGRLPSDLDILVPAEGIARAQQSLRENDWTEDALDAHDKRYYEEWSHEVPPMHNPRFELELDLHHGILPPVAAVTVDSRLLLHRLVPAGLAGWQVLCPVDQLLHSAVHLFHDSELRGRMRDLVDQDGLMRHFGGDDAFWDDLAARALQLQLVEPLALCVHYTRAWLGTPVPASFSEALQRHAPRGVRKAWLQPLLDAVLWPVEPDATERLRSRMAANVLLARYHWNRLPLRFLVPHLLHKTLRRRPEKIDREPDA